MCSGEKGELKPGGGVFNRNSFYLRQTTITHQPFHFANNSPAPPVIIIWACERECVCLCVCAHLPCITVGLQEYVSNHSSH